MANSTIPNENDGLKDLLKPFYQRASEAEDCLLKLETVISNSKGTSGTGNEQCSEKVKELESKLEELNAELAAERAKVANLTAENNKDYRILHLVRALKEADFDFKVKSLSIILLYFFVTIVWTIPKINIYMNIQVSLMWK